MEHRRPLKQRCRQQDDHHVLGCITYVTSDFIVKTASPPVTHEVSLLAVPLLAAGVRRRGGRRQLERAHQRGATDS